jgi:hypothetical protein
MLDNQIDYWHSPAAMWLWLGLYAMAGCIIAALIRNWLAEGAHFKHDSGAVPTAEPIVEA